MKASFFSRPLEWSVETEGESWQQGSTVKGLLKVKNHGPDEVAFENAGVGLAFAEVKKVHARAEGALRPLVSLALSQEKIQNGETLELSFSLTLPANCQVTDKRGSFFLTYGQKLIENHLMLKVEPLTLFAKIIGLLDTFQRFKLKEFKSAKNGVDYKLIPPTSRDMANIESLNLIMSMDGENLELIFEFQVKKLDTSSVTTKISKNTIKIKKFLLPKEYSLGRDMINQEQLLKVIESVLSEVKLTNSF